MDMPLKQFSLNYGLGSLPEEYGGFHNQKYGLLNLETCEKLTTHEPILFSFMIDVSGSMSDTVRGFRTKIQLLIMTLQNMVHYFTQYDHIYMEIYGFDSKIHQYVEYTHVTPSNANMIIEKIQSIRPMSSTNIGLALTTLNSNMNIIREEVSDDYKIGILLTDGEPTCGIHNIEELAAILLSTHIYHFIALGEQHNSRLMNALGKSHSLCCDWFIDDIELTGNVYGEILFNEMNRILNRVTIEVEGGSIYNYKTGCFEPCLEIGHLSCESKKEFHILSENMSNIVIRCCGKLLNNELFTLTSIVNKPIIDQPIDNLKQYYRLCVQKLMYDIRMTLKMDNVSIYDRLYAHQPCFTFALPSHNLNIDFVKSAELLKEHIESFIKQQHLEHDELMSGLMTDLSLIMKIKSHIVDPFTYLNARENTQGRQLAFDSGTQILDDDNDEYLGQLLPPVLERSRTTAYTSPGRTMLMREISSNRANNTFTVPYP
jgi:uncharacterized protein YegL